MKENRSALWLILLIFAAVIWFFRRPTESRHQIEPSPPIDEIAPEETPASSPTAVSTSPLESPSSTPSPEAEKLKPLSAEEVAARRQSLRASLSAVFTAEMAYRAEYDRYSSDLMEIGFQPEPGVLKFKLGFATPYHPFMRNANEDPTRTSTDVFVNISATISDKSYSFDEYSRDVNISDLSRFCRYGCTANDEKFELMAVFNLDEDLTLDVWTIDESRKITHVIDDTIQ